MILIGYSGHAFVAFGILRSSGKEVTAYCDREQKSENPFGLAYAGKESDAIDSLKAAGFFIAIGDNKIRRRIFESLKEKELFPANAVHASAIIDPSATVSGKGVMISAGAILNPLCTIEDGAIINTAAVVEHECKVGSFAHIGPGAILCGNVTVGENTFVGAGAVVRQGIKIGSNVMIGAGAVVVKDVADGMTVKGCPAV